MRKYLSNVHKMMDAHLQCVNNHNAKFKYKGMKSVGATDYTNQTPSKHFGGKKCPSSTPLINEKILVKCAQNRWFTFSFQYVNNYYAKYE